MATIDKTQSQTYHFLSENMSIEDITQQAEVKEKRRHGGKGIKIFNKTKKEPLWLVDNNLSENEEFYDAIENFDTEKSKLQSIIEKQANEIQKFKKQIEELNSPKQDNFNFEDFKYNFITTYDEKQRKKTGIEKIHEEILCINNQLYFITTLVHIDYSISEEVLYFDYYENNNDLQVINQTKKYQNINEYKKIIC